MEARLLRMLQILTQLGIEHGEDPARREEMAEALRREGFREFEITRMFEWLGEMRQQPDHAAQLSMLLRVGGEAAGGGVPMVALTERAHSLLSCLRDLGLIDEAMEEEILNQLMMGREGELSFEDVRRTAAQVIFDRQFRSGEEYYGIFEEEWKLLFN